MKLLNVAYVVLGALGINAAMRRLRSGAVILCYHNVVRDGSAPGDPEPHMRLESFESQVDWVSSRFQIVSLRELSSRLRERRSVRGLIALTFDDGYLGVIRNALPLLRRAGIPCTVFVTGAPPSAPVPFWWDWPETRRIANDPSTRERLLGELQGDPSLISAALGLGPQPVGEEYLPADWETLRAAASPLVEFGAHSMSHRSLVSVSDGDLEHEIRGSATSLEERLGVRPAMFAYPYGNWDRRVATSVSAVGFQSAFALGDRDADASADRLALPRLNIPASISQPAFEAWVSGLANRRAKR